MNPLPLVLGFALLFSASPAWSQAPRLFTQVVTPAQGAWEMAARPEDSRALACASAAHVLYIDLSRSNLMTGVFRGLVSWLAPASDPSPTARRGMLNQFYGRSTLNATGGLQALRFYAKRNDLGTELTAEITPTPGATAPATMRLHYRYNDSEAAIDDALSCQFLKNPPAAFGDTSRFYDCGGRGGIWVQVMRPFGLKSIVGYTHEATLLGNPGAYRAYYRHFPRVFDDEERDAVGHSVSFLESGSIGGQSHLLDWVYARTADARPFSDKYARLLKADWRSIHYSPVAPTQFPMIRIDNAHWFDDNSRTLEPGDQRVPPEMRESAYSCTLVP